MRKQNSFCIFGFPGIDGGHCVVIYDMQTANLVKYDHYPEDAFDRALTLAKVDYPEFFDSGVVLDPSRCEAQLPTETNKQYFVRLAKTSVTA